MDSIEKRRPARQHYRKNKKDQNTIPSSFFKRTKLRIIICIIIIVVVAMINASDTAQARFISSTIKGFLENNTSSQQLHADLLSFFEGLFNQQEDNDLSNEIDESEYKNAWKIDYAEGLLINEEKNTLDDTKTNIENEPVKKESEPEESKNVIEEKEPTSIPKSDGMILPVEGVLSKPFGERINPINGTMEYHRGIDIEANIGIPIIAVMDGEVIEGGEEYTYGKYLKINHGNGLVTVYANCSKLIVKRGQKVKKGDIIGRVGETKDSQNPHLHFEIIKDGKAVNPLDYIDVPQK